MRISLVTTLSAAFVLPSPVVANDFPTQARVEYVLQCMNTRGPQNYENLYSCICVIDKIAETFAYDDYAEAEVFALLRSTPGERGGLFRDPERADVLVAQLRDATEAAEKSCFVGGKKPNADND